MARHPARDRSSDPDALLSVAQAATLLGVHPNTVRSWTEAGRLTAYRINPRGDRRFRRSEVEGLLVEGAPVEAAAPVVEAGDPRRAAELATLARLARGAATTDSPAAVARAALEALRGECGFARAAVYLVQDGELRLETHAGYHVAPVALLPRVDDEADWPDPDLDPADPHVTLPLLGGRTLLGVLQIEDEPGGPLAAADPRFLRTAAATLAAAIRNCVLLARTRREVQRARALRSVTQELTGQLDLAVVLDDIVERTRSLFDADKAGLWLLDESAQPFQLAAHRGLGTDFLDAVATLTMDAETMGVRAVRERRPMWMVGADTDVSIGALREVYASEQIRTACLVPVLARGEALGLIGLYHAHGRTWPDEEVRLAQAFANQAGVAIQNARLYRSVADQAARMRSIHDLSARLNRLTDVTAIAEAIVAEATSLADYHDIRVYAVDWERQMCEPIAFTREMLGEAPGDPAALLRVPVGEGSFTGWVAEHGEPLLINDALSDPRGMTIDGTDDIEESMLLVPMLYEGRALGVIVLSQLGFNRFTSGDLQTMSIFAGYAAQAIANATAYERLADQSDALARQLDSQRRLLEINERLLSTLDQEGVLESIADGLHTVVTYDNMSIFRADRTRGVLVPVLAREAYMDEVMRHVAPFGSGLMGWAVDHGEPVLANDALADPRSVQIPGTPEEPEAVIVAPLVADGEVIGAMNVGRIGGEEAYFSQVDFELVQLFAGQASIAMRNADAHQVVSQQAETDALTGLGNHGAFQRDLARQLERSEAAETPEAARFSMLMMDLDSFKAYNDRHGHPAGDALLHAAGTAIYGAARSDDRVYRYGGDEFALILPGAAVPDAARVAGRVRRAVRRLTAGNSTPVTITIGLAGYPQDATDRSSLIAAADTALYYGKRAGENRVVRAGDVPGDMRSLRGTLDDLARAALQHGDQPATVEHLVERATLLSTGTDQTDTVHDALLAIARSLAAKDSGARGHGDRVARLSVRIGRRLGLRTDALGTIELAARLHELDPSGVGELEAIPSLRGVAALVRDHRLLAGTGSPPDRRRRRTGPPLEAHVVAVCHGYDELLAGVGRPRVGRAAALQALRADPAGFRSEALDALTDEVAGRSDRGSRRRRVDRPIERRGAA